MFANCSWLNEPQTWTSDSDTLDVVTDHGTDFWRQTHYGFIRDNGHAFLAEAPQSFTAQVKVQAKYRELYDQAGIMVRLDDKYWVKAGVEYTDGKAALSTVLTTVNSDWSTGPFDGNPHEFWIRATVAKGVLKLQASADGKLWPLMRLCPFPEATQYKVGPMCCTPERAGLEVAFSQFSVTAALNKDLHDLS
jgi:hypothetical protein